MLDLRVCYNGEWFVTETVSEDALNKMLESPEVSAANKQEISRLLALKGSISFYDIYHIAYPEVSAPTQVTLAAQN
ncbi:Inner membrane protein ylaC [Providencia alcalifaciens]|nr:Inner membrane protein ylaC [Providencia alcalifaciens]